MIGLVNFMDGLGVNGVYVEQQRNWFNLELSLMATDGSVLTIHDLQEKNLGKWKIANDVLGAPNLSSGSL